MLIYSNTYTTLHKYPYLDLDFLAYKVPAVLIFFKFILDFVNEILGTHILNNA